MSEKVMKTIKIGNAEIRTGHKIRTVRAIHGYGIITRRYKKKPEKSMCSGCRDNLYNCGSRSCWSFGSAEVVDKVGHTSIHVTYGPDGKMVQTLSCWHSVQK